MRRLALAAAITTATITAAAPAAHASTPCPTPTAHVWCGVHRPAPTSWWRGLIWFYGETA